MLSNERFGKEKAVIESETSGDIYVMKLQAFIPKVRFCVPFILLENQSYLTFHRVSFHMVIPRIVLILIKIF